METKDSDFCAALFVTIIGLHLEIACSVVFKLSYQSWNGNNCKIFYGTK